VDNEEMYKKIERRINWATTTILLYVCFAICILAVIAKSAFLAGCFAFIGLVFLVLSAYYAQDKFIVNIELKKKGGK